MSIPLFNIAALPIRTDRALRAVPYVTYAICFICVAIYLGTLGLSEYQAKVAVPAQWGFIPAQPRWFNLLAYAFLHVNIIHLLGNILLLWLMGTVLESGIGPWRFLAVYLVSALAAVALNTAIGIAFLPDSLHYPIIGASGAIAGVTGLTVFRYYRLRVLTIFIVFFPPLFGPAPIPIPYPVWVPMWTYTAILFTAREVVAGVLQIIEGGSMVAHWAHIGGLGIGVLAAMVLKVVQEGRREYALEDSAKNAGDPRAGKRALRDVKQLLLDDPHDPELQEAVAGLTLARGDTLRARELYLRAMKNFFAAGKAERAAIIYLNLVQVFPDFLLPLRDQMVVGAALETLGRHREAAETFERTAEHFPDSPEAENALLRAVRIYHRHVLDTQNARRVLDTFFTRYPHSAWMDLARKRRDELERDSPQRLFPNSDLST